MSYLSKTPVGKSKVVPVVLFKDLVLKVATLRVNYRLSLLPYVCDSHQDGEDEDCWQCERLCFHLQWFAFPQMKLASEKPPEAVLEGQTFPGGEHTPQISHIMACKTCHHSPLIVRQVFYGPDDGCDHLF